MVDDFRPHRRPLKPAKRHLTLIKPPAKQQTSEAPVEGEPTFRTPEEVAAEEAMARPLTIPPAVAKPKLSRLDRMKLSFSWPPRRNVLIAGGVVLVLAALGTWGFLLLNTAPKVASTPKTIKAVKKVAPKPTTVPSSLSGLPVNPDINKLPVTGVMIENSLDARPQSGLSSAGVVFEAIAEGGVTRFLALFQDQQPDSVGPIRSLRPYYLQWDMGFDAPIAHVGGSPDALDDVSSWGAKDLNQFYNGGSYQRISSRDAPHNVYTGIATLNQLEASKGFAGSNFTGFPRKADAPAKQPTTTSLDFMLSGPLYNPHFDYVAATNSYNRSEDGSPHLDANTNQPLSPKVVVAIVVPLAQGALDASGAYYSDYTVTGSGTAYIFQDGGVTVGNWSKDGTTAQITFTDSSNKPLKLNTGQTWITAVSSSGNVSYK